MYRDETREKVQSFREKKSAQRGNVEKHGVLPDRTQKNQNNCC